MSKDQQLLEEAYMYILESETDWGSDNQPYWHPGPNPTVDLVLVYNNKILLIKRGSGGSEANKWAIPGGFIETSAKKGEPFRMDNELPKQAALRELEEETGLDLTSTSDIGSRMREVGVYEGDQRDPRDNEKAWSRSHVFALILTDKDGIDINSVRGSDDASEAHWFEVNKLPSQLAFDHEKIIQDALSKLRKPNRVQENLDDLVTIDQTYTIINHIDKSGLCKTDDEQQFMDVVQKTIKRIALKYEWNQSEQFSVLKELQKREYITDQQFSKLAEMLKPRSFLSSFFKR
jgi:ADP-ribose pyrophosphatase YjhB (NUDIX family)